MTGLLFRGFKNLSLVDFPGKLCAIGFTGGCDFRCPWCYVKDLVFNYDSLPRITEKKVFKNLRQRADWIDAVVVSGGEPTIHRELPDFFRKAKGIGLMTGLETNGSNPDMLNLLIRKKLVDYIEMDVKAPLSKPKLYQKVIGVPEFNLEPIERSIDIIIKGRTGYAFRTTVIPTLLDERDVVEIAKELNGASKYYIQQFKPMESVIDKRFSNINPYSKKVIDRIRDRCEKYVEYAEIRGI